MVEFSFLTPFFFLKGGLSVNFLALLGAIPLLLGFFGDKIAAKFAVSTDEELEVEDEEFSPAKGRA